MDTKTATIEEALDSIARLETAGLIEPWEARCARRLLYIDRLVWGIR